MSLLSRLVAVFEFEWRRTITLPRLAWWFTLMAFPPLLMLLVRMAARAEQPDAEVPHEVAAIMVYLLSPCVACMMSVFLWSTPAVSSELEGRSWVYLSVRPMGPLSVLLGKYLVALSWSIPVGIVSSVVSVYAIDAPRPTILVFGEAGLAVLSCIAYSAIFLFIGVLVPRRAMVIGIMYAMIFEVAFAMIPAAVNLLTVQYRLRCLMMLWLDIELPRLKSSPILGSYFSDASSAWHVTVLLLMAVGYLTSAAVLLRYREFMTAAEAESS